MRYSGSAAQRLACHATLLFLHGFELCDTVVAMRAVLLVEVASSAGRRRRRTGRLDRCSTVSQPCAACKLSSMNCSTTC